MQSFFLFFFNLNTLLLHLSGFVLQTYEVLSCPFCTP